MIAGHIDGNEEVKAAAIREAREEAGIEIRPSDIEVVGVMHRRAGDERVSFFLAASKWSGDIVNAEPDKCDDCPGILSMICRPIWCRTSGRAWRTIWRTGISTVSGGTNKSEVRLAGTCSAAQQFRFGCIFLFNACELEAPSCHLAPRSVVKG